MVIPVAGKTIYVPGTKVKSFDFIYFHSKLKTFTHFSLAESPEKKTCAKRQPKTFRENFLAALLFHKHKQD